LRRDLGAATFGVAIARLHDLTVFRETAALGAGNHHVALNIG
jgi:hypothetical protein